MKKKLLIITMAMILLTGCNNKTGNELSKVNEMKLLSSTTVKNYDIFDFEVNLSTDENSIKINREYLSDIPIYQIDANIYDGFNYYSKEYYGIKFSDILDKYNYDDYTLIYIDDKETLKLGFYKTKLTDNWYLVFKLDGDNDNTISLARFDISTRYWLHDVKEIVLTNYPR